MGEVGGSSELGYRGMITLNFSLVPAVEERDRCSMRHQFWPGWCGAVSFR
jgi:hypothetical protein